MPSGMDGSAAGRFEVNLGSESRSCANKGLKASCRRQLCDGLFRQRSFTSFVIGHTRWHACLFFISIQCERTYIQQRIYDRKMEAGFLSESKQALSIGREPRKSLHEKQLCLCPAFLLYQIRENFKFDRQMIWVAI